MDNFRVINTDFINNVKSVSFEIYSKALEYKQSNGGKLYIKIT